MSLCRQLLSAQPGLFQHVTTLYTFLAKKKIFTEDLTWGFLWSVLTSSLDTAVYCIIDAIDDCVESQQQKVLQRLEKFAMSAGGKVKLLLSSKDSYGLEHDHARCRDIVFGNDDTKARAVELLVKRAINQLEEQKPCWKELRDVAIAKLSAMPPDSTYLLAEQRLALLQRTTIRSTRATIEEQLNSLPSSLEQCYSQAMGRVESKQWSWIWPAITWIVHAVRPLKTTELAVAIALEESGKADTWRDNIPWSIMDDLEECIGPLFQVVTSRVYPIHWTFREYLASGSSAHVMPADVHYPILVQCLRYLASVGRRAHALMTQGSGPKRQFIPRDQEYGLLTYTSIHWPEHFLRTDAKPAARDLVLQFLQDEANIKAWEWLYRRSKPPIFDTATSLDSSLKIVCNFGLLDLVNESISYARRKDDFEGELQDALEVAARHGHANIVARLLDEGARSPRALSLAAAGGFVDVLKLLRDVHSSLDALDEAGYAPIQYAICSAHPATVKYLLDQGARSDISDQDGNSLLHLAGWIGSLLGIEHLVEAGLDVRAKNNEGYDALKYAAQGGFHDVVGFLRDSGADICQPAMDGNRALHLAAEFGQLSTVSTLLEVDNDVDGVNACHLSPIHLAAREGHIAVLQRLLKARQDGNSGQAAADCADDLSHKSPSCEKVIGHGSPKSALEWAAERGHANILDELLDDRFGHQYEDCCAALFWAARRGHAKLVKRLLDHGVQALVVDEAHNNALHVAARNGYIETLCELVSHGSGRPWIKVDSRNSIRQTPLHVATAAGHLFAVEVLMERGASLNAVDENGKTPLHFAAAEGHVALVKLLRKLQDRPWNRDKDGKTAFDLAVERGNTAAVKELLQSLSVPLNEDEVARMGLPLHSAIRNRHEDVFGALIDRGLDPGVRDEAGNTPLHVAAEFNAPRVVDLLLENHKCDPNVENEASATPLHLASKEGHSGIVRTLLKFSADKDKRDSENLTPVWLASYYGHVKVVEDLVAMPLPEVKSVNHLGWTALHAAYDNPDVTQLLLGAKAEPDSQDHNGYTPIALAAAGGHAETIRVLLAAGAATDIADMNGNLTVHLAAQSSSRMAVGAVWG
jgi:ankyrin